MPEDREIMEDERAFYPGFLESLTVLELAKLQHDLRSVPDDKSYLDQVLREFRRREKGAADAR